MEVTNGGHVQCHAVLHVAYCTSYAAVWIKVICWEVLPKLSVSMDRMVLTFKQDFHSRGVMTGEQMMIGVRFDSVMKPLIESKVLGRICSLVWCIVLVGQHGILNMRVNECYMLTISHCARGYWTSSSRSLCKIRHGSIIMEHCH